MKILYFLILLLSINLLSFGQCSNFHQEKCDLPFNWDYEFNSQSISTGVFPGQAFRIKAVLYEGNDYYIGFCNRNGFGNMQFKLIADDIEIDMSYAEYENKYLKYFELSIEKTRIAVIEVKIGKTQAVGFSQSDLNCIGIIIGNKTTVEAY